jgi:hypothetical protein
MWPQAWDVETARYDPSYTAGNATILRLHAGPSFEMSDTPIRELEWRVTGISDTAFEKTIVVTADAGEQFVDDQFPGIPAFKVEQEPGILDRLVDRPSMVQLVLVPLPGRYEIELTVRGLGRAANVVKRTPRIRPFLIASLGDSMASGEGSPDQPGHIDIENAWFSVGPISVPNPLVPVMLATGPGSVLDIEKARWTDRRCHRSSLNGHAIAATLIEGANPGLDVTFLSFACSGAKIQHVTSGSFAGIDPPEGLSEPIPAQLSALREHLEEVDRTVNALFVTIGVNDLGFSDVVKTFAMGIDKQSEIMMALVDQKLRDMPDQYGLLIDEVEAQLGDRVSDVYLTSYPSHVFHDDNGKMHGCGFLDLTSDEAEFIFKAGRTLNEIIDKARREKELVHFVPRLPEVFHGHGYCCSESWFVGVKESLEQDQNFEGVVHPNPRGHLAIAEKIANEVQQVLQETADERWSRWHNLGGQLGSGVAVTSGGPHALDVFVVGENKELVHRFFDGQEWSGWHNLGGQLGSGVAVTSGGPHALDVFVRGENFELVHRFFDGQEWSGWHNLGGTLLSGLAVASGGVHTLDVFARGERRDLMHRFFEPGN